MTRLATTIDSLMLLSANFPDGSAAKTAVDHAATVCSAAARWRISRCTNQVECWPSEGTHSTGCEIALAERAMTAAIEDKP